MKTIYVISITFCTLCAVFTEAVVKSLLEGYESFGIVVHEETGTLFTSDPKNGQLIKRLKNETEEVYKGFTSPHGIWFDNKGHLIIADPTQHYLLKISDPFGEFNDRTIIAGLPRESGYSSKDENALATSVALSGPMAGWADLSGNHYIAELEGCMVRRLDSNTGQISLIYGRYLECNSQVGHLHHPYGITGDHRGSLYVTEFFGHRVTQIDLLTKSGTALIGATGKDGFTPDGFFSATSAISSPTGITCFTDLEQVLIVVIENTAKESRIRQISPKYHLLNSLGAGEKHLLSAAQDIAHFRTQFFITDPSRERTVKIDDREI